MDKHVGKMMLYSKYQRMPTILNLCIFHCALLYIMLQ